MFGRAKDAHDILMDENRLWDFADRWLPEPGPATPGIESKQAKRPRTSKSPLPQRSKVPESTPKMFSPGGSTEEVVSNPPKVMVVKDPKCPP
eukprot:3934230-Karenia_brevis.AAC.1